MDEDLEQTQTAGTTEQAKAATGEAEQSAEGGVGSNDSYVLLGSVTLWGIVLVVFVRSSVAKDISELRTSHEATGMAHVLGNKGGVALGFRYNQVTSFLFVNSHLAARASRLKQRADNYKEILKGLNVCQRGLDVLHSFHHIFWIGDLNYRVQRGRTADLDEFNWALELAESGNSEKLLKHDQLRQQQSARLAFWGFYEAEITFPPTYRMLKGQLGYSNKKHQNPSYTDRILHRSLVGFERHLTQLSYAAAHSLLQSDHRPVCAEFRVVTQIPYFNMDPLPLFSNPLQFSLVFKHITFEEPHAIEVEDATPRDKVREEALQSGARGHWTPQCYTCQTKFTDTVCPHSFMSLVWAACSHVVLHRKCTGQFEWTMVIIICFALSSVLSRTTICLLMVC